MESLVIFAVLGLLLAAVAPGLYALRGRMSAPAERLEFWQALRRRGLSGAVAAENPLALGVALRRCTFCPSADTCGEWLASGRREGLEDFCPNAGYLERLERQ